MFLNFSFTKSFFGLWARWIAGDCLVAGITNLEAMIRSKAPAVEWGETESPGVAISSVPTVPASVDHWWDDGNRKCPEETCPTDSLFTTKPTWTAARTFAVFLEQSIPVF
jgi:hypothetical protein